MHGGTTREPRPTSILPVFGFASKKEKVYLEKKNLLSASSYFLTAGVTQRTLEKEEPREEPRDRDAGVGGGNH